MRAAGRRGASLEPLGGCLRSSERRLEGIVRTILEATGFSGGCRGRLWSQIRRRGAFPGSCWAGPGCFWSGGPLGLYSGCVGGLLGRLRATSKATRAHGRILQKPEENAWKSAHGALLGRLSGASWAVLEASWAVWRLSWACWVAILVRGRLPGLCWAGLGGWLAASWAVRGPSWAIRGPSCRPPGLSQSELEGVWGRFGLQRRRARALNKTLQKHP